MPLAAESILKPTAPIFHHDTVTSPAVDISMWYVAAVAGGCFLLMTIVMVVGIKYMLHVGAKEHKENMAKLRAEKLAQLEQEQLQEDADALAKQSANVTAIGQDDQQEETSLRQRRAN